MPWYRNGHSVPVVYRGRESSRWWVDWSSDEEQRSFSTWQKAIDFALTTHHPHPTDSDHTEGSDHA